MNIRGKGGAVLSTLDTVARTQEKYRCNKEESSFYFLLVFKAVASLEGKQGARFCKEPYLAKNSSLPPPAPSIIITTILESHCCLPPCPFATHQIGKHWSVRLYDITVFKIVNGPACLCRKVMQYI